MSEPKLNVLITGGTGFIGKHLLSRLTEKGHTSTVLTRGTRKSEDRFVTYLTWNGKEMPLGIGVFDVVINLAGAGIAEEKWTKSRKEEILQSRLDSTAACVKYINASPKKPKAFLSASAVGYYGTKYQEEIDEKKKPGDDFAAQVCVEWEEASKPATCRTVNPRIGVVLGKGGGAMKKLIPIYNMYLGGTLAGGKQGFPWIHIEDIVSAFLFCIENDAIEGPVNLVSPQVTDQKTFSSKLADALNKIDPFPAPKFALELALGERSILLWGGQKAIPRVLQREKFVFKFSELTDALEDIV